MEPPGNSGSLSCHGNTCHAEKTDSNGNELEFTSKKTVFLFFLISCWQIMVQCILCSGLQAFDDRRL